MQAIVTVWRGDVGFRLAVEFDVVGENRPATMYGPAEYAEVEVLEAKLADPADAWDLLTADERATVEDLCLESATADWEADWAEAEAYALEDCRAARAAWGGR